MSISVPMDFNDEGAIRIITRPPIGVAIRKKSKMMRILLCTYRNVLRSDFLQLCNSGARESILNVDLSTI